MAGRLRLQWGLRERLLGVLGLGRVVAMTANVAIHGFGMKVTARSVNHTEEGRRASQVIRPASRIFHSGGKQEGVYSTR
jgi:phosphoglycerate dehydrogenase-like enzyme